MAKKILKLVLDGDQSCKVGLLTQKSIQKPNDPQEVW